MSVGRRECLPDGSVFSRSLSEDCRDERFDSCFTVFFCFDRSLRWFELWNGGRWSLALLMFRGLVGCSLVCVESARAQDNSVLLWNRSDGLSFRLSVGRRECYT